jgi:hypothetical protein
MDLSTAQSLKSTKTESTEFIYVTTNEGYVRILSELPKGRQLALDSETMVRPEYETSGGSALDPHTGRISLIIIQPRDYAQPVIFDLLHLEADGYDKQLLIDYLEACEFILGANIKFDSKQLRGTLDYEPTKLADVIVMAKLISNACGSKAGKAVGHSYGDLCREYLNIHLDGKGSLQVSTWSTALESRNLLNEWWVEKLTYAAKDVKYLFELYDIMYEVITLPLPHSQLTKTGNTGKKWGFGMDRVLKREFEFITVVADMEYNGLPLSKPLVDAFQEQVVEELNDVAVYLSKELELDTPQRNWCNKEVPSMKALKTLRSAQGLLDVTQRALDFKKIDNVQALVLKRMLEILEHLSKSSSDSDESITLNEVFMDADEADLFQELTLLEESEITKRTPVLEGILKFKRLVKQDGMNLTKYLNVRTKRIHPSYNQLGAATSRLSSSGPNAQQISNKTQIVIYGEALNDLRF